MVSQATGNKWYDSSGVAFRWPGYEHFILQTPPYPNGSRYVPGQGSNITVGSYPAITATSISGGTYYSPDVLTPLIWDASPTVGPYFKPLIVYDKGPIFTEKTIQLNVIMPINNVDDTLRFRIFQERSTHILDVFGVRYVEAKISYESY